MTERMHLRDPDLKAAAAGIVALAAHGIPVDVQELLVHGDPMRGIKPGALSACIKATLESYQSVRAAHNRTGPSND